MSNVSDTSGASLLRQALAAPAILTEEKSFRRNAAIGSARLNAKGLHRWRVKTAHRMAARRRAALGPKLNPAERAAFDRDGIVVRENAVPPELCAAVMETVATHPMPAWEIRQGPTANRVGIVSSRDANPAIAALAQFANRPDVVALTGYAGGRTGHILAMLQTVLVQPSPAESGEPSAGDPQANLHADTFHPTSKFWLFLHDVPADEGPFQYAPGSHILTPERLAFEHREAQLAATAPDKHHAAGSFRVAADHLPRLGYDRPLQSYPVKAGTLVVADTYGFHRRSPSAKATVRTALYGVMRCNPFLPWNGLHVFNLPGLREQIMPLHLAMQDKRAAKGLSVSYNAAGTVLHRQFV